VNGFILTTIRYHPDKPKSKTSKVRAQSPQKLQTTMAGAERLELTTLGFGDRCSLHDRIWLNCKHDFAQAF